MEIKQLAKQLRSILFNDCDCDALTSEFERVLELCDCEYEVTVMENDRVIIVDVSPCILFIRKKKSRRIYEVVPEGSPLKEYSKGVCYDKEAYKERKNRRRHSGI